MKIQTILEAWQCSTLKISQGLPNFLVYVRLIALVCFGFWVLGLGRVGKGGKEGSKKHGKINFFYFLTLSLAHQLFPLEPILFRLLVEYEDGGIVSYYGLFDPKSALPPRGGGCEALYETNQGVGGEGGEIVSGLSFIVVSCGGWEYYDGDKSIVGVEVYYETQDGDNYPRNQTGIFFHFFVFFSFLFFFFFFFFLFLFFFFFFFFYKRFISL